MTFDHRTAWQVPILQNNNPQQVFMKCSQVGVTVIAMINMLYLLYSGIPGLYVLPTGVTMYDFVKNRLDPILNQVPFYARNYAPLKDDASGARLKTIFRRRVKFAGSNVRNSFFEMPAGWYIIDEMDRCDQTNLAYLEDRISRAAVKYRFKIGNPTFDKTGIHAEYLASDQGQWMIQCDHCNEYQPLDYFSQAVRQVGHRRYVFRDRAIQAQLNDLVHRDGIDVSVRTLASNCELQQKDARIYCSRPSCQRPIDRHAPGEWVPARPGRPASGYHINKMFGDPNAGAIVNLFKNQTVALHDPNLLQRWFNNDLGIPYEEKGSRITDQLLADAAADYSMPTKLPVQILQHDLTWSIMGVDVGATMHVTISGMFMSDHKVHRIKLFIGQVQDPVQLHDLIARFNVKSAVFDMLPETRMVRQFCRQYPHFYMALYSKHDAKVEMVRDDQKRIIQLGRTESLDASLAAWDDGLVLLPMNWRSIDGGAFVDQMKMPVRMFNVQKQAIEWTKGEDHYRHADSYELWASRLPGAAQWGGMKGSL